LAPRDDIVAFANELLDLDAYPDYGPMGLQVVGARDVEKIACGVSASRELFERAGESGAQLVLVHHGLFWDNEPRAVGETMRGRLTALFAADLSLAAYHLALDAHPELGNNALLARELGIETEERFATFGFGGKVTEPVAIDAFAERVRERLGRMPMLFPYGPERVGRAAVCSGGAAKLLSEAISAGYDCFVTGEAAEPTKHAAKEGAIHFVAAGHYATETLGVQALAARIADEFDVAWEFIDLPNPV
jgi:dinuclear metal center YbgI/SA1388 family protein